MNESNINHTITQALTIHLTISLNLSLDPIVFFFMYDRLEFLLIIDTTGLVITFEAARNPNNWQCSAEITYHMNVTTDFSEYDHWQYRHEYSS